MGVKREDAAGNDPENGSPDADRGGTHLKIFYFAPILPKKLLDILVASSSSIIENFLIAKVQ